MAGRGMVSSLAGRMGLAVLPSGLHEGPGAHFGKVFETKGTLQFVLGGLWSVLRRLVRTKNGSSGWPRMLVRPKLVKGPISKDFLFKGVTC